MSQAVAGTEHHCWAKQQESVFNGAFGLSGVLKHACRVLQNFGTLLYKDQAVPLRDQATD